jgi:hypothetical protein
MLIAYGIFCSVQLKYLQRLFTVQFKVIHHPVGRKVSLARVVPSPAAG